MTEPLLKCVGLAKSFGDFLAVRNVSFEVYPGEIVSILGSSGSGKTTLLRLIAGLEAPSAGEVIVQGTVASTPDKQVAPDQRAVGMVVQEYALFPHMTVEQNIAFGLHGLDSDERAARVTEVMELVQLPELGSRYPHELSGGQQQRVALARTLAPRPVTILMDEPFSNVDAGMRNEMRREVEAILRDGKTAAVFVTHDRDQAFAIADRVGIMSDGEMAQVDTPEAVYHLPVSRHVARLAGACDFLSGTVQVDGTAFTEVGVFPILSAGEELGPDADVDLLIRPDDFGIEVNESGTVLLESREFRGDETMLVVTLPSGATLRCSKESFFGLPAGIRVDLVLRRPTPFAAFRS